MINGRKEIIAGSICVLSADNPASCALGGYKESASANRPCRHCMISSSELSSKLKEKDVILRNPGNHLLQVQEVESQGRGNEASKQYGINRHSVLDELQYFKVASGVLVPDILHDVLEDALQHEVKLVIRKFIQDDRYFTIDEVNQKIDSFDFGYLESKNRPTPLCLSSIANCADHSLKQSGIVDPFHHVHKLFLIIIML